MTTGKEPLVASLLFLVAMPGAPSSVLLFLVAMPGALSSILAPSSDARSPSFQVKKHREKMKFVALHVEPHSFAQRRRTLIVLCRASYRKVQVGSLTSFSFIPFFLSSCLLPSQVIKWWARKWYAKRAMLAHGLSFASSSFDL